MSALVVTVGAPGSGKSSMVRRWLLDGLKPYQVLSSDAMRVCLDLARSGDGKTCPACAPGGE